MAFRELFLIANEAAGEIVTLADRPRWSQLRSKSPERFDRTPPNGLAGRWQTQLNCILTSRTGIKRTTDPTDRKDLEEGKRK